MEQKKSHRLTIPICGNMPLIESPIRTDAANSARFIGFRYGARLFLRILMVLFVALTCSNVTIEAQTIAHGRETDKGEINFTQIADSLLAHPVPLLLKKEIEDNESEEAPPPFRLVTDSSLIRRTPFTFLPGPELPSSPPPADSFQSVIQDTGIYPPDTHGAVDSNYCVTVTNQDVKIQTKTGVVINTVPVNTFFSPFIGSQVFDPRVHYDPYTHRWIIIAVCGAGTTASSILLAISKTSVPTGGWWEYRVLADFTGENWLDFPNVGYNNKWIVVSGNQFPNAGGVSPGAKVFVFNKSNLLSGTGAPFTSIAQPGVYSICPSLNYDATESNLFAVSSFNATSGLLQLWKITGLVGSETMTSIAYPATSPWQWTGFQHTVANLYFDFAPQAGTPKLVQTGLDDRISQCTYINGKLWLAHTIYLPYSVSLNPTRSSIQWWQLDTFGTPLQVGRIDSIGFFYGFPSLTVNTTDDALIGFATFSATLHPSAAYALRMHTDPVNVFRQLYIFRHGQNSYYRTDDNNRNRWGDYSGTTIDIPNMSDFYTVQESVTSTANIYDTWWAHIKICSTPARISRTTDTICAGSSVTLTDTTTGGTWSSSDTTTAAVDSLTGLVTGVLAGTALISYTVNGGCFTTATITVNPSPDSILGPNRICTATLDTFRDSTIAGVWTSSNTSAATVGSLSGIVNGITAGATIITYTKYGCYVTRSVTVNVTPYAIVGSNAVCTSMSTTYTDATTGGSWSSSSAGIASVGMSTGIVTGVTAGTAIISYVVSSGCFSYKPVTVSATPSSISGTSTICTGIATTFTDGTSGGAWSSSNTSAATVSSGVVTGVSAGLTEISYTVTGCSAIFPVTVIASPYPVAGTSPLCAGSSASYINTSTGGTWSSSNPGVGSVNPVSGTSTSVTGVSAGTTTISYILSSGCASTKQLTVFALPLPISGTSNICTGTATTFTDGTPGGNWNSSNTSAATVVSGVVTGVSAGATTISYTVSGCSKTFPVTVIASPYPIAGSSSLCIRSSTTFNDATTSGTWSSSNPAVGSLSPISGTSTTVTGVSPGTSSISYTLSSGCTATKELVVITSPLPIAGTGTICTGIAATFTDGTPGGTWASSNTSAATVVSGAVSGVSPGAAIISYSITGCSSTFPVTVYSSPYPIAGAGSVCTSASTPYSDVTSGGTWSSSNAFASVSPVTGTETSVTGAAAGAATISYIVSSGCYSAHPIEIYTSPDAISGTGSIDRMESVTFTDLTPGGSWSSSNTSAATVTGSGVVTGISYGITNIIYTATDGCTASFSVFVSETIYGGRGIGPYNLTGSGNDLVIIPNPNKGIFIIRGAVSMPNGTEVGIQITDMMGQVVYNNNAKIMDGILNEQIQLSNLLENGMYIINIQNGVDQVILRFVLAQ